MGLRVGTGREEGEGSGVVACVEGCEVQEALAREGFWVCVMGREAMVSDDGDFGLGVFWGGKGGLGRTVRVELENVEIAICVGDDHVELFSVREEIGGDDFDAV